MLVIVYEDGIMKGIMKQPQQQPPNLKSTKKIPIPVGIVLHNFVFLQQQQQQQQPTTTANK